MKRKNISRIVCSLAATCSLSFLSGCDNAQNEAKEDNLLDIVGQRLGDPVEKSISVSFPKNNESVHILKPRILNYINAMYAQAEAIEDDYVLHDFYAWDKEFDSSNRKYGQEFSNETDKVRVSDFTIGLNEEKSKDVSLVFDARGFEENATFAVKLSKEADLSNPKIIETQDSFVTVNNLLSGQKYYWQVSSGDVESSIESFVTDSGFRMISAGRVTNIRDMGGRLVSGGKRIKQGLIYRGGELVSETYDADDSGATHSQTLFEDNLPILQDELGIKYEIDFRGDAESNYLVESPLKDENHPDVEYLRIPNMSGYDDAFSMKSEMWAKVKTMFLAFRDAETKPVYFHCWGGADRTGTAGFLLGSLLGMSFTDLVIDFELTSFSNNYRPHEKNDSKKIYRFPELIGRIYQLQCKNDHSKTYYEEGKPLKDIMAEILMDYAGLSEQDINDIRSNLLEDVQ